MSQTAGVKARRLVLKAVARLMSQRGSANWRGIPQQERAAYVLETKHADLPCVLVSITGKGRAYGPYTRAGGKRVVARWVVYGDELHALVAEVKDELTEPFRSTVLGLLHEDSRRREVSGQEKRT